MDNARQLRSLLSDEELLLYASVSPGPLNLTPLARLRLLEMLRRVRAEGVPTLPEAERPDATPLRKTA